MKLALWFSLRILWRSFWWSFGRCHVVGVVADDLGLSCPESPPYRSLSAPRLCPNVCKLECSIGVTPPRKAARVDRILGLVKRQFRNVQCGSRQCLGVTLKTSMKSLRTKTIQRSMANFTVLSRALGTKSTPGGCRGTSWWAASRPFTDSLGALRISVWGALSHYT